MATRNMGMARGGGGKGRVKWVLLVGALLLAAALVYAWPMMRSYSQTGTAYAARVVCSCRYIGGRSLDDCEKDLEPGMGLVSLSEANNGKRIDASMLMLASDSAEFREGYGCVLMTPQEREAAR